MDLLAFECHPVCLVPHSAQASFYGFPLDFSGEAFWASNLKTKANGSIFSNNICPPVSLLFCRWGGDFPPENWIMFAAILRLQSNNSRSIACNYMSWKKENRDSRHKECWIKCPSTQQSRMRIIKSILVLILFFKPKEKRGPWILILYKKTAWHWFWLLKIKIILILCFIKLMFLLMSALGKEEKTFSGQFWLLFLALISMQEAYLHLLN